jgi:diaminopimelate epimerase
MNIPFTKMQAQGNDFVIIEKSVADDNSLNLPKLAKAVCDRHFGIGADGLVILDLENLGMVIYNADGSRPEMCGSALRCCCYLLAEKTGKTVVTVQTESGLSKGMIDSKHPDYVTVELGIPRLKKSSLTVQNFTGDLINTGNPHFVVFRDELADNPHLEWGRAISEDPVFPQGANVEFIRIISRQEIELVVWERGAGATLACGTGSVASVFAGQNRNLLDDDVTVRLPGGSIKISKKEQSYQLSGSVTRVASGVYVWII